jgi:hypothetical protein
MLDGFVGDRVAAAPPMAAWRRGGTSWWVEVRTKIELAAGHVTRTSTVSLSGASGPCTPLGGPQRWGRAEGALHRP